MSPPGRGAAPGGDPRSQHFHYHCPARLCPQLFYPTPADAGYVYPVEFFPQVPTVNGVVAPKCVAALALCWTRYRECERHALSSHRPTSHPI